MPFLSGIWEDGWIPRLMEEKSDWNGNWIKEILTVSRCWGHFSKTEVGGWAGSP